MAKKSRLPIHMTERALLDVKGIHQWSVKQFGRSTASKYLSKIESGLSRIGDHPELLRSEPAFHDSLKFYRVEKHLLVCETAISGRIIVLTVVHASMDVFSRLADLEPTLKLETGILLQQLKKRK